MKKFLYFIVGVAVVLGFISAFWWLETGETLDEQVDFTSGVLGNADCSATVPVNVNIIENGYNGVEFGYIVMDIQIFLY